MEWSAIKNVACGTASEEETRNVKQWAAGSSARRRFLRDAMRFYAPGSRAEEEFMTDISTEQLDAAWHRADPMRRRRLRAVRWAATSAAVVALVVGVRMLLPGGPDIPVPERAVQVTLADGTVYDIKADAGEDMVIPGFEVSQDGSLAQTNTLPAEDGGQPSFIEISVPHGTTYTLVMADSTRIKLNARSSLRFSSSQVDERRVALNGEAWFEVVRNEQRPFVVEAGGATVRVLGTDFNVRAYEGGSSSVVLVSGSVEVGAGDQRRTLSPGEQCDIEGDNLSVTPADLSAALAWSDNKFIFKDAPLHAITEELSRWYGVEVLYEQPDLRGERFYVFVERSGSLVEVMDKIAKTGIVSYRTEPGKLIISD